MTGLGDLGTVDIARGTGAHATTVRAWLRGERRPSSVHAERLGELAAVVERLAPVMRRRHIRPWLTRPSDALGDRQPIDVIAVGDYRSVSRLISALEGSAVS